VTAPLDEVQTASRKAQLAQSFSQLQFRKSFAGLPGLLCYAARFKPAHSFMNSRRLCRLIVVRIAALTAVIIGLSVSSASATTTEAKAVAVKGSVKSGPPAAPQLPQVQQGSNIRVGHAIKTAEVSELLMSPFQGSAVRVLEKSSVVLEEADLQKSGERVIGRKAVLELKKGPVQVIVDPKAKADFKISTPQCVAAARGTVYQTSAVDKETTVTIVLRGEVVVTCEDSKGRHETVVKAGMKLITRKKLTGGKEVLGPGGPGPGDCISELEPATKEELASLAQLENEAVQRGLVSAEVPAPPSPPTVVGGILNPKDISGAPVVSPEQP
jgi:FecR-like protein